MLSHGADGNTSVIAGAVADEFLLTTATGTYDVLYNSASSAADVAAAINRLNSGVTASALTQVVLGGTATTADSSLNQNATYTFQIANDFTDGSDPSSFTTVSFKTGGAATDAQAVTTADQLNSAVQAFNDVSGKTGFTAEAVQTEEGQWAIKLTSESGKDLRISNDTASSATAAGTVDITDISVLDGDTVNTDPANAITISLAVGDADGEWDSGVGSWITGRLVLDSDKNFSITTVVNDFLGEATGGTGTAGTFGGQLQSVSQMDVSSYEASLRTLSIADSALAALSSQRARYGAIQGRFENAITNLQTTAENLTASRSRIQDTDFAAETANLTRAQILQQAGVAMLAQANALPNTVLSLLQQ